MDRRDFIRGIFVAGTVVGIGSASVVAKANIEKKRFTARDIMNRHNFVELRFEGEFFRTYLDSNKVLDSHPDRQKVEEKLDLRGPNNDGIYQITYTMWDRDSFIPYMIEGQFRSLESMNETFEKYIEHCRREVLDHVFLGRREGDYEIGKFRKSVKREAKPYVSGPTDYPASWKTLPMES